MVKIQDFNLQDVFSQQVYRRGMTYYREGRVKEPVFDRNHQIWTTAVKGSEWYFVELNLKNLDRGSIAAYCDCPAFETYQTCKHVAAVLIHLSEQPTDIDANKLSSEYYTSNRFINSIASIQPAETDSTNVITKRDQMKVEYYMRRTFDDLLYVELKAGVKRPYVVKDAVQFLENVQSGRDHLFTKAFTYSPDNHYFLQQDRELLDMLYVILQNEQIYFERRMNAFGDRSERAILIPPLSIKPVLEKLVERPFSVESDDEKFSPVSLVEDDLPFHFAISKNKRGEMVLEMEDMDEMHYLRDYHLLFHRGDFYFPRSEQLPIIDEMSRLGMRNKQMPVTKEQSDVFVSEVLPTLKKIGDVQIEEKVASEIIQVPLKAELYLDVQQDWVIGKLQYIYGEHVIDPFNGREMSEAIIIRDVDKERQIMALIEQANFHYNGKELYIEASEENLYDFLYHILPLFEPYVDLFLTSELRNFMVEHVATPSTRVEIESASNLLEVGFTIDGIDDEEVNQVLNAVMEKKRYYRLNNGALLSLEGDEFTSMQQLFDDLNLHQSDLENGTVEMPVYRGAQIDELVQTRKDYDPAFRKLLSELKSPEEQVFPLPDGLNATLRDYQRTGYQWFKALSKYQLGGILADDMGLGKTLQAIAFMLSESEGLPHLIVAPSSVVYNWMNECHKFAPDLETVIMTGTPQERRKQFEHATDKHVWITSYATLRQDIDLYRELKFQTLILDESQYIKNYATKTSQAIREVKATKRFALSGTPIENSIDELWAVFQVILPGLMPSQREFRQLANEKIMSLTKPFILRRLKEDVLQELPEKIETVHVSELTKDQKQLYLGYLRQLQQEAAQSMQQNSFSQDRMKILAGLTRLRQICCHPSLFVENYQGKSGKLEQLLDTVENRLENGKRMLIFSQFTSMHEILMTQLQEAGIEYFYLHGGTPSKDRVEMSERFNAGEKSVFLISLKAGGTGLNLTGADTVILYDLWWNPAVEDQATDRAHRFGQKNVVQVIRLITEGTIEEKIYDLQQKKRELIDQVIKPGDSALSSLSEDDIKELLSL